MYYACGPGLLSMSQISVRSVRRTHRASEPPAHIAAARGRLAKNDRSKAPFRGQG